ncbi:probable pleiotropic drug resistance protein 1 [Coccomyxa sp. Obi]|nr:probable pleiotropic drug resistance protein 1 [Coccomyxa sp. Obi]
MTDNNWCPGFHQGISYDPNDLFRNQCSRRRMSLGADAALGADEDRDPEEAVNDYDELVRVALERASTFDQRSSAQGEDAGGFTKLDLKRLGRTHRQLIVDRALQTSDQDNELFLRKFRERVDRAGVDVPTVEVRADGLSVDSSVYVGGRAMPTLINAYRNFIEDALIKLRLMKGNKRPFNILNNVNAVLKPGRMTLLLGPPGAGKTTLLKTLAGKLQHDPSLKVIGQVTYNGETFDKFYPQRTAAYVDQVDLHIPELTVRETFDFAARVQGTGLKAEFLRQLREAEKKGSIAPDPDVDAYLGATAVEGARHNPVTNYILRVLGLEVCADTAVGNNMIRGISGGQKKRVTTGEMVVGPKATLFLDEISTGLDSSTTHLIVKCARNFVHMSQARSYTAEPSLNKYAIVPCRSLQNRGAFASVGYGFAQRFLVVNKGTMLMALLQPAPEVFEVFDDVMLLSEGHIIFHGPIAEVLPFFESLGFRLPERKGIADFLQEVTSRKDQEQYWADPTRPWSFMPVATIAEAYEASPRGRANAAELARTRPPPSGVRSCHTIHPGICTGGKGAPDTLAAAEDGAAGLGAGKGGGGVGDGKPRSRLDPLVRNKYALSPVGVFAACFLREYTLMKRHSFVYIFRTITTFCMGILASTLFIRPTMHRNNVGDASLYAGVLFYALVHMLFDGFTEMALTIDTLPVFFKQRDNLFYPAWAFALPTTILRLPYSFVESFIWSTMLYWIIGFAPDAGRYFTFWLLCFLCHQMAIGLFRLMGAIGRSLVVAYTIAWLLFLLLILLSGFVLSHNRIPAWYIGGYWTLPLQWLVSAAEANEFSDGGWAVPYVYDPSITLGRAVANNFDFRIRRVWVWVGVAVACAWIVGLNILTILAMQFFPPLGGGSAVMPEEQLAERELIRTGTADPVSPEAAEKAAAATAPGPADAAGGQPPRAGGDIAMTHRAPLSANGAPAAAAPVPADTDGPAPPPKPAPPPDVPEDDEEFQDASGARLERFYSAKSEVPRAGSSSSLDEQTIQPTSVEEPDEAHAAAPDLAHASAADMVSFRASQRRLGRAKTGKGMVLPFQPLNMAFHHVYYSVDLPSGHPGVGETVEGASKPQLTLLTDITGAFRPGVLTCLMGVSGAGKTTLMDVLASRKTGGIVRGDITVDGHPKDAATFARVSGYVEQFDIHSPAATVREALMFSAQLRLVGTNKKQLESFVDEVLELMELTPLRNAIVGVPGVSGLSVEQRKRLTIGVELVANPSIVFMDEPTSGLDARAAAIVMRTVRNTVNTGRTVVCTIHQPSIDIFESFDELLLLKRGGRTIYFGPTGERSAELVSYFESVPGVPRITEGANPATWMLEVTAMASEDKLGMDFADVYANSGLAKSNEDLVTQLQVPAPDSQPLRFEARFPRSFLQQFMIIIRKNFTLYWRLPDYNAVRLVFTCIFGLLIGSIFWRKGNKTNNAGNIQNVLGALLTASIFLGTSNASTVQPVVDTERSVFYRERAAGYYGELPFALAQTLVEIPYLLVQSVLYSCTTYFMIYFAIDAAKFFWYLFFIFLTLSFFTYYGMMAVSISPNVQVAAIISSTFYSGWFLLAGFIIPRPRIPGWWIWFHYLDPLTYTVEGLIASQLGDIHDQYIAFEDGTTASVAQYIRVQYDYKHDFIGYCVLILCGFILLFQAINAYALKNFNFQTR